MSSDRMTAQPASAADWLVTPVRQSARVLTQADRHEIALDNGLARRVFRLAPNFATVGLDNLSTQMALLRGVKPEAILELDGHRYEVGGLKGQPDYAYLNPKWLDQMTSDPQAFQYVRYTEGTPQPRFAWKRKRYAGDLPWRVSDDGLRRLLRLVCGQCRRSLYSTGFSPRARSDRGAHLLV